MAKYLLLIFFFICVNAIQAQLYCINYDVIDGLPSENITAIGEDNNGYMYIGTSMGLSYFDGANFHTVGNEGKGKLPYNVFVEEIRFDKNGNVWISTEHDGLFRLEIQTNTWIQFSMDEDSDRQIPNNIIWDIEILDDKVLVACENKGLITIDINTLIIEVFDHFKDQTITDIFVEDEEAILLSTHYAIYSIKNSFNSNKIDTLFLAKTRIEFTKVYEHSDGRIFTITYSGGLFQLENGRLIKNEQPTDLDSWRFNIIDEYEGKLWLTLKNHCIASIDLKNDQWQLFESQAFNKNSLPKGKYNMGFKDSRNILWIATTKGLSSINPVMQSFKSIDNIETINEYLLDAVYDENRKQYVMLYASEKNKLKIFDEHFNEVLAYNHTPTVEYIQSIWSPISYKDGYLCLGHDLLQIDCKTGNISKAKLPGCPNIKNPKAITLDSDNNLWIVDDSNNLLKYSIGSEEVLKKVALPKLDKPKEFSFRFHGINDCGKYIAIAAQDVLMMVDKSTYQIHFYDVDKSQKSITKIDKYPSKVGSIMQIVGYEGSFYICTRDEGVYRASFSEETLSFTVTSYLSSRELNGPVELAMDEYNDLWIATDNGLVLTDKNLKIKKKIGGQHGLPNTKLSQGLSIANGKIILNNENGITTADINLLRKETTLLPIDIKSVLINNEQTDLNNKELPLAYHENNVQINVSMPLYSNRSNLTYSYRLLPINEEWNEVNVSQSSFRYDNLQADDYTFEIKASNEFKNGKISQFYFKINPPFWKTYWFLVLISILVITIATVIYKARLSNKLNQEKIKTKLAELQNEAIRAQLNPHFIFNALNSIRSLILMDKKEGSLNYLGSFSTLVREILSISKEEYIPLSRELEFNQNYVNIEKLRFSQSLIYEVSIAEEVNIEKVNVPPMIMQPFIENAIWHGLLGKKENAKLKVIIEISDGSLLISIDDNGLGRKKKTPKTHHTFETKKSYGELLSKQRLQTFGSAAEIKIVDKMENGAPLGTTVIIKLPLKL